ncbi:hypothetical protein [Dyella silvatica]|uniref:hypothetical protein n=1 Tax=Dyella silvatica TaxID=2992128 RepID=UPI00225C3823|nr:hypothetical protein [Dyella silvatica]
MKFLTRVSCAILTLFAIAACQGHLTAASSDGQLVKTGQAVYPRRGSFGCNSLGELNQASSLKAQQNGSQLYDYLHAGHCGLFEDNETANVLRIEKGDSYDALVVNLPDQPSAPHEVWIKSSDVSAAR